MGIISHRYSLFGPAKSKLKIARTVGRLAVPSFCSFRSVNRSRTFLDLQIHAIQRFCPLDSFTRPFIAFSSTLSSVAGVQYSLCFGKSTR